MKWILAIMALLLPLVAVAQETAPIPLAPSNVQIIDGKKFFSLNNARRMQPSSGPPSPAALAVINHPRTDFRVAPSERLAMTPVTHTKPTVPLADDPSVSKSDRVKNELLSIFAPDGQHYGATPTPEIK